MAENLSSVAVVVSALRVKNKLFKKLFHDTIRVSNGFNLDQSVGPDLGPNSFYRLSTDDKSRRVKFFFIRWEFSTSLYRPPDKRAYLTNIFLISQPGHAHFIWQISLQVIIITKANKTTAKSLKVTLSNEENK